LVTASICGNGALNGQVDCDPASAGQSVASPTGLISIEIVAALPPKPCPCVVRTASIADPAAINAPFEINGAPTATPVADPLATRSLQVGLTIVGSGPLVSYFGGPAQRDLLLNVRNSGNSPLDGTPVTVAFGKGDDPTESVLAEGGGAVALPPLQPGQNAELRIPVTIDPVPFGSYTAKATFAGLDAVIVDGQENSAGDLSVKATTSAYPWGLILVAWLVLQIPLLGLYKRRPVVYEAPAEDPLLEQLPVSTVVGADPGFAGGMFGSSAALPPPPPAGFVVAATATAAAAVPTASAPAIATEIPGAMAPVDPAAAAQEYAPEPPVERSAVFGVDDLRAMMNGPQQ
jgi:hypothetical protein